MNRRLAVVVLAFAIILLMPSCAPKESHEPAQVDSLRVQAEELIKAQSLMGWNSWAFGAPSNQDSLYKANASLFTLGNIKLVQRVEQAETSAVQKKRLAYFVRYLTTEYVSKANAALSDEASNLEARATVTFEGKSIPYRQVNSILSNEQSHRRRAGLYAAVGPVLDSLNIIQQQIEENSLRLAKELGYPSYNRMAEELKGFSLDDLRSVSERVLAETESTYTVLLNEILRKQLRLTPAEFQRCDIAPIFRNAQFDRYFPGGTMIEVLKKTYQQLGITIDEQHNLRIDSEVRPAKNPRAVCYPIDVPNDIRLSIKPIGGFDDYSALFHEMGHGEHYANTRENAMEFKYLGEPTVTENFAFLSEYLLSNQAWLRTHTTMPTAVEKDFLRFQAFHRLYFIRRYSAKLLYELQLHSGIAHPESLYAALQSKALEFREVPSDAKRYLTDLDAFYYAASYLRAWYLEAQLNEKLTRDYGVNWFENPAAGQYLRSLWSNGDRYDGNELVQMIGDTAITPDALMKELKMLVAFSAK